MRLRLRVKRRSFDLDRRLAAGVDPMESDELSLRVGQLGSAASRSRLASAVRSDAASRLYHHDDGSGQLADAALEALEALDRGHLTS